MSTRYTPGSFLVSLKTLHAGLGTPLPSGSSQLGAAGKDTALADLQAELAGYVAAYQAVEDTAAAHTKALLARAAVAPDAQARYAILVGALKTTVGARNPDLLRYGIAPTRVAAPRTAAQEEERVARAKATRLARRTMGRRQRAAIKGQVATPAAAQPPATEPSATH